ncbi:MAG: sigma-54-dependent Fis family transcriptional regulator [Spirochaetales bacterium]|nr:sigma-54-dependent Fis family transcriptional regulator [Spirochaetales bacterium]
MIRIVFIGNEKKFFTILKMSIQNINISLIPFSLGSYDIIQKQKPDIVILDLDLEREDWPRLIRNILNISNPPSLLVTGTWKISKRIIKAIQMGALDYIPKPFNPENIFHMEKAIILSKDSTLNKNRNKEFYLPDNIVGSSNQIQSIKDLLSSYAKSDAAILLLGESGVGKNLIAENIHRLSNRRNSKYKTMHTAALPPTLIESELYGTDAGAFTDAKSRAGYFESANKGTLFLDEIGEIPLESQVKLLRILEEKTITRIGGNKQIPIDVRVISATNINISNAVKNKTFREDLYYRINTLMITIPPLRERVEDIPLLIEYFLNQPDYKNKITNSALEKLITHPWPGNIRELKNTLIRSRIHAGEKIPINESHIIFN